MLKKIGMEDAPKEAKYEIYSGKWKTVKEFELDKDVPKKIKLPEEKIQMYYLVHWRILAQKAKEYLNMFGKQTV